MTSGFELTSSAVHIWHINLQVSDKYYRTLADMLVPDEVERAAAFYFERDRRRFTIARGGVRLLLAHYTNREPRDLTFTFNPYGKPSLGDGTLIQFNLSHSHDWAVCAVGQSLALGIDLEYIRPIEDMQSVARHTFSPNENAVFNSIPTHRQQEAFFRCWTRKEAYIKALGEGLSHPLDSFDVTLASDEPARLLRDANDPAAPDQWLLYSFHFSKNYIGALASRQGIHKLAVTHRDFAEI